jgi:hypothetical protein
VYSRSHLLDNGQTFSIDDRELGQLALGDIHAVVNYKGQRLPKGPLTLEWSLDGIDLGRKNVQIGSVVDYRAEPHAGNYTAVLRLNGVEMGKFQFRISP